MVEDVNNMEHQKHYKKLAIEPIDIIWANFSKERCCGFLQGNIVKYSIRYEVKNKMEDLDKVRVYTEWLRRREADLPRVDAPFTQMREDSQQLLKQ